MAEIRCLVCDGFGCEFCPRARMTADDAEYWRGYHEAKEAQQAGPPGSPEREAAYREMEERWAREGFDG